METSGAECPSLMQSDLSTTGRGLGCRITAVRVLDSTGIGQVYEICRQLRGAHENQVEDAAVGLAHNLGGSGAVCTVTVLGRGDRR